MRLFRKKKKSAGLTRDEAMACVPLKNPEVSETHQESGVILLTYPVRTKPVLAGLAEKLGAAPGGVQIKKLELDELGTDMWKLMDGKHTVRRLIGDFSEKYQLHEKEAEVSVTQFLRELGKRGLVGLK